VWLMYEVTTRPPCG